MQAIIVNQLLNQHNTTLQTQLPLENKYTATSTLKFGDLELQEKGAKLLIRTNRFLKVLKFLALRVLPWILISIGLLGMSESISFISVNFSNWFYLFLATTGGVLFFIPIHTYDFIENGIFYRNTNYFQFSIQTPLFISKNTELVVDINNHSCKEVTFSCNSNDTNEVLFSFCALQQHSIHDTSEILAWILSRLNECNVIHFRSNEK